MNAPQCLQTDLTAERSGAFAASSAGWQARLELGFARRAAATIPILRSHRGPLRVRKGFTPEGKGLWHQVIVHPPCGIASGDHLAGCGQVVSCQPRCL